MTPIHRRRFCENLALGFLGATTFASAPLLRGASASRKMTLCLSPGSIGVSVDQLKTIDLASRHGFESVEPFGAYLAGISEAQLADLLGSMKAKNLVFGAASLPTEFRRGDDSFQQGLRELPKIAGGLQKAGVTRIGTWLMPGHGTLTYLANLKQHATRLRQAAQVLKDHELKLGLEYVGTPTVRAGQRYPFVHTLQETQELISEIGLPNVGVVLDSWHWFTAQETPKDLLSLQNHQIVSVDLNDAPAGIPLEKQIDGQRELPCATGVIPVAAFLQALNQIGYDGPVRAEPFNKKLNQLPAEESCAATAAALKKAMATIAS